tara:strand:+ start:2894 stop:3631 length:738 start_codon:yes stop_codon:yes gene_type:complete
LKFLVAALIISQAIANQKEDDYAKAIIDKTESQYRSIKDYQVKMTISMKIPAFRMPKKKYTVFFKQPDKLEIKSKGFGLLPRTGMFTSPSENFDNLTDVAVDKNSLNLKENRVILRGNLIVDSLAIKMPNDYAKVTFKPTVDVTIDTSHWVITEVVTKIDTIKIMQINNEYGFVDGDHFLPVRSTVEYFVKDARISKWLKKDIGSFIGNQQKTDIQDDMVKGKITVLYSKYRVNRGIDESVFKKN